MIKSISSKPSTKKDGSFNNLLSLSHSKSFSGEAKFKSQFQAQRRPPTDRTNP